MIVGQRFGERPTPITSGDVAGKRIAARHHQRIVHHRGASARSSSARSAAGTTAEAEVDAARRKRIENAKTARQLSTARNAAA